jgi:hypothetical protein
MDAAAGLAADHGKMLPATESHQHHGVLTDVNVENLIGLHSSRE